MKKRRLSVLCVVLLLLLNFGCAPAAAPPTGETVATTAPTDPHGARIALAEVPDDLRAFAEALCAGNAEALRRFTGSEQTAALLATVKVTDYAVKAATDQYPYTLSLEVSESALPSIPVGHSAWWVYSGDREYFSLRLAPADISPGWLDRMGGEAVAPAVKACYVAATTLRLYETVPDYAQLPSAWAVEHAGELTNVYVGYAKERGEQAADDMGMVEQTALSAFVRQMFGIAVSDFSAARTAVGSKVGLAFYGGEWNSNALQDYSAEGDTHTVTIRFFADKTALMEAVTVRYVLKETENGFRLCSSERLSGTDLPPMVLYL